MSGVQYGNIPNLTLNPGWTPTYLTVVCPLLPIMIVTKHTEETGLLHHGVVAKTTVANERNLQY
jgi:hypothetical protein